MFINIILYIHILSATAWIGGSLFLFALGILLRDKDAQKEVYNRIGPIYGIFESFFLISLLTTGTTMFMHFNLQEIVYTQDTPLAHAMKTKLYIVVLITFATLVHLYISLKMHKKERTLKQKIISRSSSLAIFILNLVILWFAMSLRTILS